MNQSYCMYTTKISHFIMTEWTIAVINFYGRYPTIPWRWRCVNVFKWNKSYQIVARWFWIRSSIFITFKAFDRKIRPDEEVPTKSWKSIFCMFGAFYVAEGALFPTIILRSAIITSQPRNMKSKDKMFRNRLGRQPDKNQKCSSSLFVSIKIVGLSHIYFTHPFPGHAGREMRQSNLWLI